MSDLPLRGSVVPIGDRPKRGRPPNVMRRECILQAAELLFARNGYDGATMHEIAETCEIRDSLLYRYYRDKPSIFDALLSRSFTRIDAFIERLQAIPLTIEDPGEDLKRIGVRYYAFIRENHPFYMLWFMSPNQFQPYEQRAVDAAHRLYRCVDVAIENTLRGTGDDAAIRVRTRAFLSAIFGYTFFRLRLPGGLDETKAEDYITSLVDLWSTKHDAH